MSKKFDVVIGNPPYQEEVAGDATSSPPIYPMFMDAAYEVGTKVVLITPARFLFNAGYTSKLWNKKMLGDPHLSVPVYVPKSDDLFPGTDIEGGVAVTYRDSDRKLGPIGTFSRYPELSLILDKVSQRADGSFGDLVTKRDAYRYTQLMHDENAHASAQMSRSSQFIVNSNAFEQLAFLFLNEKPVDGKEYVQVLGVLRNKRSTRWTRRDYLYGPKSFQSFKVAIPKANGSQSLGGIGEPLVVEPSVAVTQTFLTIGNFDNRFEAEACLKYVKSKFARALLGILKITQDNPARTWQHVPLQDFTSSSDIDWSQPISQIDQQLYAKYKLDASEIAFIESHVRPME